jgi:tetratricopeptide (TPR) repeat protein
MERTNNARDALRAGVLLVAVTLAAYWPVLQNGFVSYDDRTYVTENPHMLGGMTRANVGWALQTAHAGNWHPLTWLSHLLDVQLFGLKARWHHLTSLLFHTANALLLVGCLRRMTGALWRSAAVAALFALHPLHVESVAWVAERKDVLSTFFFLLTLWAYARYAEKSVVRGQWSVVRSEPRTSDSAPRTTDDGPHSTRLALCFYVLSLCFFALGLMSKPMLVTLPFLLLLLDYWPLKRMQSAECRMQNAEPQTSSAFIIHHSSFIILEKVPFFALSLASCVTTFIVQRGAGAVSSLDTLPLDFRIANALVSYVRYAAKMVWPAKLAVFYPAPAQWPQWWVAGAALILVGVSALAVWRARTASYLAVGWFWYLGTLVPVIGIVQVGQQAMADRYSYIPLIGLFIMLVWSAAEIPGRWPATNRWVAAGGAIAIGACAALTWRQAGYWQDSASLFEHALAVTRDNAVAQNNLGVCFLDSANVAAAESHFAEAVRIRPRYPEALANLGLCREQAGREDEALELLQRSVQIQGTAAAHYDLANLLAKRGELEQAEAHYRSSLKAKPELAEAWYNLGLLKARQGKAVEADQCYSKALQFRPGFSEAHASLGAMLAAEKKFDAAIVHFQAALQTAPGNADAQFNLASALNAKGDFAGAAQHYAEACRLRPDDMDARQNLALALLYQAKLPEAAAQFQEVLRARPNAGTEHYLALALDAQGQVEAALPHYREAVRLSPSSALFLNDLAWVLATNPKAEIRDGAEAVRLAEQACKLTGGKEPRCFGTLDAAYAEVGRFDDAVATATKTRELALASGQQEIAQQAASRLALYRARKPYRMPVLQGAQP